MRDGAHPRQVFPSDESDVAIGGRLALQVHFENALHTKRVAGHFVNLIQTVIKICVLRLTAGRSLTSHL